MRSLYLLVLALVVPFCSFAQNKTLEFYYIDYDGNMDITALCSHLKELHDDAWNDKSRAIIFYLPLNQSPKIVKMNLHGDNRERFEEDIIACIQRVIDNRPSEAQFEYDTIMTLISQHDFLDDNGQPTYESVLFRWYVTPTFWSDGYNESLIAKMYFTLDIASYPDYIMTEIWYQKDAWEDNMVDWEAPFGGRYKGLCDGLDESCFRQL